VEIIELEIQGLVLLKPKVFNDDRGYFYESYNKEILENTLGFSIDFVQDNESLSSKDVLRGLHFQEAPFEQAKLVRVIKGRVTDVCVDIRSGSPTFGKHIKVELSEQNKHLLFIPAGFAHGFVTREDNTIFSYKCSSFYNRSSENSILWNDQELGIDWEVIDPIISDKDRSANPLKELDTVF